MLRTLLAASVVAVQVLAGCSTTSPDSKAAREFATAKDGVCCFVGMRNLSDEAAPRISEYPNQPGAWADANRSLTTENANAEMDRRRAASQAAKDAQDVKEAEDADLARRNAAMRDARDKQASEMRAALTDRGSVELRGIFFDFDKSTIKPESENALFAMQQVLNNDRSLKIEIQGHTDNVGSRAYNEKLSHRRAEAVKNYMVEHYGIPAERLSATGLGETTPAANNDTSEGRAENRRVMLIRK